MENAETDRVTSVKSNSHTQIPPTHTQTHTPLTHCLSPTYLEKRHHVSFLYDNTNLMEAKGEEKKFTVKL